MKKRNIEVILSSPRIIICTLHVLHSSREMFCHSIQMIASPMRRSLSDTERLELGIDADRGASLFIYVLDTTAHWVREGRNIEVAKYTSSRATDR